MFNVAVWPKADTLIAPGIVWSEAKADIDRSSPCAGLAGLAVGGRRQEAAAATIRLLSFAKI